MEKVAYLRFSGPDSVQDGGPDQDSQQVFGGRTPEFAMRGDGVPLYIGKNGNWADDDRIDKTGDCLIIPGAGGVSRKHLALRIVDGCLQACDFGSSNGTYVDLGDGRLGKLRSNRWFALPEGKDLLLGRSRVGYELVDRGEVQRNFALYTHARGEGFRRLRGTYNDLVRLSSNMVGRGFRQQDSYFLGKSGNADCSGAVEFEGLATPDNVLAAVRYLVPRVLPDDVLLFHYSGHANREGKLCLESTNKPDSVDYYERIYGVSEKFSLDRILPVLGSCRGKVLMILDACYSLNHGFELPENVTLMGHNVAGHESEATQMVGMESGGRQGLLTRAFCRSLESGSGSMTIDQVFDQVLLDPKIRWRGDQVGIQKGSPSSLGFQTQYLSLADGSMQRIRPNQGKPQEVGRLGQLLSQMFLS